MERSQRSRRCGPRGHIHRESSAPDSQIAIALEKALRRGVDVVVLVPAQPEENVRAARRNPERRPLFDRVAQLGRYENFALVGIAALNAQGRRSDVYVHAKIMLIDDEWATIGSSNLHSNSLSGYTEINASIWDGAVVRPLRCALLAEHLGHDTENLDARSALRLYRSIAVENRRRRDTKDPVWRGIAYRLDPASYGE